LETVTCPQTLRKHVSCAAQVQALYALYRKIRNLAIPIDVQLKLFDSLITLIFVYSCEVWGFENKQGIEKIHLQYCKRILNLRSSTPNFMVYGEIGRFPVEIIIKLRMATFWNNMLCNNNKPHKSKQN
jgi:hypothetical protein